MSSVSTNTVFTGSPSSQSGLSGLTLNRLWHICKRRKTASIGILILVILLALAIFAPLLSSFDPNTMKIAHRLQAPNAMYWFGTDEFGRDLFTRVIYGAQVSLTVGLLTVFVACIFGVLLGVMAGFFPRLDASLIKIIDAMMAFPDILLAIALVSVLGPTVVNVVLALGIVYTPRVARIVRASTLVLRELPFVEAARALGVSTPRIIRKHIVRNLMSPIIVQGTFIFTNAILAESGLSFLGVGVSPDTPTWGTIISAGQQYSREAAWIMIFPGIAIVLSVFSLQLVGDSLRDILDPKLLKDL